MERNVHGFLKNIFNSSFLLYIYIYYFFKDLIKKIER